MNSGTLAVTGGTLTVQGDVQFYAAVNDSGGALNFAGADAEVAGLVTQTSGGINVLSGWLTLSGTGNSFGGKLTGAAVNFANGSDTLAANLTLSIGQVLISGAAVTLGRSLTDAGVWTQTGGTLALGGQTLTETGTVNLDGGVVTGAGTLAITKSAELSSLYVEGSAILSNTGSITQTGNWNLGYYGTDTAQLTNQAGATFSIADNTNIGGSAAAALVNAGTLIKQAGGGSQINVAITSTGSIVIGSGVLTFTGPSNSFGGGISGPGELHLYYGSDKFVSGLSLTVGSVLLDYAAALTLTANLTYGGTWTQFNGTLSLGGQTLTETGTVDLDGGVVTGTGTLAITKSAELSGLYVEGSAILSNTGSITQTGNWNLGYYGTDTAQLTNQAGATYSIADNTNISGSAAATLVNAGTLIKRAGGESVINVAITSTGSIVIGSGVLTFAGPSNSFNGSISGPGELRLYYGSDKFASGLSLTVANVLLDYAATLTLTANLAYGGTWTQINGTLALGGQTLTETGTVNLDGGVVTGAGTLAITKSAELSGLYVEGSVILSNTGSVTQTGNWNLGYYGTDTAKLANQAGATFNITDNANISGAAAATLVNAGTLVKSGGSGMSTIGVATINTGVVHVGSGTMEFLSTVTGTGHFVVGSNTTLQFAAAVAAGGTVSLGSYSDLLLQAGAGFGASIAGFSAGDLIELNGMGYSGASLSFNAAADRLTITNGSSSVALQFLGSYGASSFHLFSHQGIATIGHI